MPLYPKIVDVSAAFELNFWQHVIFEVAARHLLYAYSQDISEVLQEPIFPPNFNLAPYDIKLQLVGLLGGEAGTGKSTVIDALLTFAEKWGRVGSVETLAFTGAAAINIKEKTMHSARHLKLNGAEPKTAPTTEMKLKFNRVILVIIDEISITDQTLLGGTDAVSRSMSSTPEKFMGGRYTLLTGDHLQLPPIGGSLCFKVPRASADRFHHGGYQLYTAIKFVVFLTKNMRARFDAGYTKILHDLRWGRLSDDQIDAFNTRVQTKHVNHPASRKDNGLFYCPVVVCTNKHRSAVNNSMIFQIADARRLPIYECLAVPSSRSRKIVENLANVSDDRTGRMPMKLLYFIGMPVMLTRKHPMLLDADIIANGVVGTIVGTFPPVEELPSISYTVSDVMVHKLLRLPQLLLIKVHGCQRKIVTVYSAAHRCLDCLG